jgi:hypothetical protein
MALANGFGAATYPNLILIKRDDRTKHGTSGALMSKLVVLFVAELHQQWKYQ